MKKDERRETRDEREFVTFSGHSTLDTGQKSLDTRHSTLDTICAISTPPGVGGIAVARISGPDAISVADSIWRGRPLAEAKSHTAHYGTVTDAAGDELDDAVVTVYRAPRSYTGDDVVEIAVHGSLYVQRQLIHTLIQHGARLAEAGEFTRRAFTAGRLDLAQAEAVADIIASENRAAHRIAVNQMRGGFSSRLKQLREQLVELASLIELELDFAEEDVEFASREKVLDIARAVQAEVGRLCRSFDTGAAIKQGIPVAIIGATNAGKSSLLNALLDDNRAIVSDIHGTTRDVVEDRLTIGDYTFLMMDTAGLRHTTDTVERLGIERSARAAARADIVVLVVDSSSPIVPELPDTGATPIVVYNKSDLATASGVTLPSSWAAAAAITLSAKTGEGVDALRAEMQSIAARGETAADGVLVTNARHYEALLRASESIARVIDGLNTGLSGDFIAMDIRETTHHLGSILGTITSDTLLHTIFSRFCIGK